MLTRLFQQTDERDINQLIYDFAEYGRDRDYKLIMKKLPSLTLYASMESSNVAFHAGTPYVTQPGDEIALPVAHVPGVGGMAIFYADQSSPRLERHFLGLAFSEACRITVLNPTVAGMFVYNHHESYVGLLKPDLLDILRR